MIDSLRWDEELQFRPLYVHVFMRGLENCASYFVYKILQASIRNVKLIIYFIQSFKTLQRFFNDKETSINLSELHFALILLHTLVHTRISTKKLQLLRYSSS